MRVLITAVAMRSDLEVFTTDANFPRFAQVLPLRLHAPWADKPN